MSKPDTAHAAGAHRVASASSDAWSGSAPLSDRINSEPAILRGLSSSEIITAAAIFFPIWVVIGLILGGLFHFMQLALLLPIGGPLLSVWVSAGMLARIKRNRPQHYYWHALQWWLHKTAGFPAPFLAHQGTWDVGRAMPPAPSRSGSRKRRSPTAEPTAPTANEATTSEEAR